MPYSVWDKWPLCSCSQVLEIEGNVCKGIDALEKGQYPGRRKGYRRLPWSSKENPIVRYEGMALPISLRSKHFRSYTYIIFYQCESHRESLAMNNKGFLMFYDYFQRSVFLI